MVSGRFIKVFYKTTTCPKRPLLSGSSYTGLTVISNTNPKTIFGTKKKLEQLELCQTEYCQGLSILSNFEWINTQPNLYGCLGHVLVLQNTFIKNDHEPNLVILDRYLVFIHTVNVLQTKKICWNKDLQFRVFWYHSWKLKMFLVTFDFEHISRLRSSVIQVGVILWN